MRKMPSGEQIRDQIARYHVRVPHSTVAMPRQKDSLSPIEMSLRQDGLNSENPGF
jgi:hypothetical protein